MNSQRTVICSCGKENLATAFYCEQCNQPFDGSAGNSIRISRAVTRRDFLASPGGNGDDHAPVPAQWPAGPPKAREKDVVYVAIVGFSEDAVVRQDPVFPGDVSPYVLTPDSSTNAAAGLARTRQLWQSFDPAARLKIALMTDGEMNDKPAALTEADELKRLGAQIAAVAVEGATKDHAFLKQIVSAPAQYFPAGTGSIVSAFVRASQSLSSRRGGEKGPILVVFVVDESGSMSEQNKQAEVEEAVRASLEYLSKL